MEPEPSPQLVRSLLEYLRLRVPFVLLVVAGVGVTLGPTQMLLIALLAIVPLLAADSWRTLAASCILAILGLGLAVWPVFTLLLAALAAVAWLAVAAPPYAFVLAIVLFGLEGSLKAGLAFGSSPFPGHGRAIGAAALDFALALAVLGLTIRWRARTMDRSTKVVAVSLAAWLAISVVQVPQSGHVTVGLNGFRLTQAYVLLVFAGLAFATFARDGRALRVLLAGFGLIAAYAGVRAAIGPSVSERVYALSRPGGRVYGDVFPTIGSFSGAVGLVSYLTPVAVFSFAVALGSPRHRGAATVVFALASAAVVASYTRAGILAVAVGIVFASLLGIARALRTPRQRLLAAGAVVAVLATVAGGTAVASKESSLTESRAKAFIHPLRDESMKLRLETWRASVRQIAAHPFGTGLGTVGGATAADGEPAVTTDNTYLKIFREQGYPGGVIFVVAVLVALGAAVRSVWRSSEAATTIAVGGVAAFVSFLVLAVFGEYAEQPGKTVAWMLIGLALAGQRNIGEER